MAKTKSKSKSQEKTPGELGVADTAVSFSSDYSHLQSQPVSFTFEDQPVRGVVERLTEPDNNGVFQFATIKVKSIENRKVGNLLLSIPCSDLKLENSV